MFHTENHDQPSIVETPCFQTTPKDAIFWHHGIGWGCLWIPMAPAHISPSSSVAQDENGEVPHQGLGLRSLRPWHAIGGPADDMDDFMVNPSINGWELGVPPWSGNLYLVEECWIWLRERFICESYPWVKGKTLPLPVSINHGFMGSISERFLCPGDMGLFESRVPPKFHDLISFSLSEKMQSAIGGLPHFQTYPCFPTTCNNWWILMIWYDLHC